MNSIPLDKESMNPVGWDAVLNYVPYKKEYRHTGRDGRYSIFAEKNAIKNAMQEYGIDELDELDGLAEKRSFLKIFLQYEKEGVQIKLIDWHAAQLRSGFGNRVLSALSDITREQGTDRFRVALPSNMATKIMDHYISKGILEKDKQWKSGYIIVDRKKIKNEGVEEMKKRKGTMKELFEKYENDTASTVKHALDQYEELVANASFGVGNLTTTLQQMVYNAERAKNKKQKKQLEVAIDAYVAISKEFDPLLRKVLALNKKVLLSL